MGLTPDEINRIMTRAFVPHNEANSNSDNDDSNSNSSQFYNDEDNEGALQLQIAQIIFEMDDPQGPNMTEESRNLDEIAKKIEENMNELFYSPAPSPAPSPPSPNIQDVEDVDDEITLHYQQEAEDQQIEESQEILPPVNDDDDIEVLYEQIRTHPNLENLPGVERIKEEEKSELKIVNVRGLGRPFMVYKIDPNEKDFDEENNTNSNEFAPPIPDPVDIPAVNQTLEETTMIFQPNQNQVEQKEKTNQKKTKSQKPATAISTEFRRISTEILMENVTTNQATANTIDPKFPNYSDKDNKKKKKNRIFKTKNPINEPDPKAMQDNQENNEASNTPVVQESSKAKPDDYSVHIENAKKFNELFIEFLTFLKGTRINTVSKLRELNEFYLTKPVYFKDVIKPTPYKFIEVMLNEHEVTSIQQIKININEDYTNIRNFNPPTFGTFCGTIRECINEKRKEIEKEKPASEWTTEQTLNKICTVIYKYYLKEVNILRESQEARILQIYKKCLAKYPAGNYPFLNDLLAKEQPSIITDADPYQFVEDQIEEEISPEPEPVGKPEPEIKSEKILLRRISTDTKIPDDPNDPDYTPNKSGRKRKSTSTSSDGKTSPIKRKKNENYQSILVITID